MRGREAPGTGARGRSRRLGEGSGRSHLACPTDSGATKNTPFGVFYWSRGAVEHSKRDVGVLRGDLGIDQVDLCFDRIDHEIDLADFRIDQVDLDIDLADIEIDLIEPAFGPINLDLAVSIPTSRSPTTRSIGRVRNPGSASPPQPRTRSMAEEDWPGGWSLSRTRFPEPSDEGTRPPPRAREGTPRRRATRPRTAPVRAPEPVKNAARPAKRVAVPVSPQCHLANRCKM